jgi:hypothetical protein
MESGENITDKGKGYTIRWVNMWQECIIYKIGRMRNRLERAFGTRLQKVLSFLHFYLLVRMGKMIS